MNKIKKYTPILYYTICIYLMIEVIVLLSPFVLPPTWYLSVYLSDTAKQKTKLFFQNKNSLIPDELFGWKNRPNMKRNNWIIDEHGSRATHKFSLKPQKPVRVMFLGSSMINGGSRIKNTETISAYIEDKTIESINFATMMYSLDQIYLSYQRDLQKYNPNIIFVGIDLEPVAGLANHYIPFRYPHEENVPYLKPRFILESDKLILKKVEVKKMLTSIPYNQEFIDFLLENDSFFFKFKLYCHMGFLPLSDSFRHLYLKFVRFKRYLIENSDECLLLETLMGKIVNDASKNAATVIFIMNTDLTVYLQGGIYKYLPDLYGERILRLKSKGYQIVDVRQILRASSVSSHKLFMADQSHYSVISNRIIANALRPIVYMVQKKRK